MSAKDRLKQAFEFSLVASYTRHLIAERPWSSGRKVLEERHGTLRTSFSGALDLSSALPGSLDLGMPPIDSLIRRAALSMIRKRGNRFSEKIILHQKDGAPNRFNLKPSRAAGSTGRAMTSFDYALSGGSLQRVKTKRGSELTYAGSGGIDRCILSAGTGK